MKNKYIGAALFVVSTTAVCAMWIVPVQPHENITTTVLFDREIVRILNNKCVACHAENALAFPLTTYVQTRPWANAIKDQALRRHMPPWGAVAGYGQFVNDLGLTLRETQFIVAWVEGNGPKSADQTAFTNLGNLKLSTDDVVLARDFDQWMLGQPDLLRPLTAKTAGEDGRDGVIRTVVDVGLTADRWVRALDYKPEDRRVVRAASFSLQETGQWLGSWTPWYGAVSLPEDTAYRVPAGSHIVAEVHYRSAAGPVEQRGTLGLYFAQAPPANIPTDLVMRATDETAANATQRVRTSAVIPNESYIVALRPELDPGAQSIEVTARTPDGHEEPLLFVRDIFPEWPTPYIFRQPVLLAKGSEVMVTSYFKNAGSARQTANVKLTISRYDKRSGAGANPSR